MKNILKSMRDFISSLSHKSRFERSLKDYCDKAEKYMNMSDREIELRYIKAVTKYECDKLQLVAIVSAIFITLVMGAFKNMLIKLEQLVTAYISYSAFSINDPQNFSYVIMILLYLTAAFSLLYFIFDRFKQIKNALFEKLFLEEIKRRRKMG